MATRSRRLRLKATVAESKPPIWRTIDIDSDAGLDVLHQVLQVAFGWLDYHLHEFTIADPGRRPAGTGRTARAGRPLPLGDDWLIRLEFVGSRRADADEEPARVVKAKLRSPTEDSGGIGGWEDKRRGWRTCRRGPRGRRRVAEGG